MNMTPRYREIKQRLQQGKEATISKGIPVDEIDWVIKKLRNETEINGQIEIQGVDIGKLQEAQGPGRIHVIGGQIESPIERAILAARGRSETISPELQEAIGEQGSAIGGGDKVSNLDESLAVLGSPQVSIDPSTDPSAPATTQGSAGTSGPEPTSRQVSSDLPTSIGKMGMTAVGLVVTAVVVIGGIVYTMLGGDS